MHCLACFVVVCVCVAKIHHCMPRIDTNFQVWYCGNSLIEHFMRNECIQTKCLQHFCVIFMHVKHTFPATAGIIFCFCPQRHATIPNGNCVNLEGESNWPQHFMKLLIINLIGGIKSRRMRWAGHVAHMGGIINAHKILVQKSKGKRPLGRHRCRW
jgi:hypothetical protein